MSDIQPLCTTCQQERQQFLTQGDKDSPGCAALWRRAFTKDEAAWHCVQTIFEPWVKGRCRAALQQAPKIAGLSSEDLPDVVQDVWHNIWRYTVNNRAEALGLVATDDISRVIGLLKTTIKNRVLELCRKPRAYLDPLPDDDGQSNDDGGTGKGKSPEIDPPGVEWLDQLALLQKHIKTTQEYIIAELIFLQQLKPQDVFDLHPKEFASVAEVNQVRQTLTRRLRSDPARQKPGDSASLQFRLDDNEVRMDLFELCPFDEGILLDYVNGHVSIEIQIAIERSPACVQAAAALQADLVAWRPALRQMFCHDSEWLVAYQEQRLTGNDRLIAHTHVKQCPDCQAELQMLAAVDAREASLVRRIYELLFQPATLAPVPVRGEGSYRTVERTPQIELLVRTTRTTGKQRNWLLVGRLRYADDQPFAQVEAIIVQGAEDEDAPEFSTTVDEHGAFTVKGLDAGRYRIHILTATEEIILHDFRIGDRY